MKAHILYDLFSVYSGRSAVHGGGVYGIVAFRELVERLAEGGTRPFEITALISADRPPDQRTADLIERYRVPTSIVKGSEGFFRAIQDHEDGPFYTALPYGLPALMKGRPLKTKILGTLHGLRELEIRYDAHYRRYQRNPLSRFSQLARHLVPSAARSRTIAEYRRILRILSRPILTVSDHSRHSLASEFEELSPEDLRVIPSFEEYVADSQEAETKAAEILDRIGLGTRPYILLVGCNRPVKNAYRVIEAAERRHVPGLDDYSFLCIGFRSDQERLIRRLYPKASRSLKTLPYQDRTVLNALYKRAACFAFPSISEGFGYPPLEAMRYGVPVIASGRSSVPEVCGDAALFFDPYDLTEIAARLNAVLSDGTVRAALSKRGMDRYERYRKASAASVDAFIEYLTVGSRS